MSPCHALWPVAHHKILHSGPQPIIKLPALDNGVRTDHEYQHERKHDHEHGRSQEIEIITSSLVNLYFDQINHFILLDLHSEQINSLGIEVINV